MSPEEFFTIADRVVQANGREPLSSRQEVVRSIEVYGDDRVLQILAGPGSGKTEVLVWRILYDIVVLGTDASRILVTTFTRKAANELQVRIADRSDAFLGMARDAGLNPEDPRVHNLRVGTLHSLCEQLLTEFDPDFRASGLTLIDEHEHRARLAFMGDIITGRTGGCLSRLASTPTFTGLFAPPWKAASWPSNRFDRLSLLLDIYMHTVETYIPRCCESGLLHGLAGSVPTVDADLLDLQRLWSTHLQSKHVIDFAGIQLRLLVSQRSLNGHISHVFVDEFQDNNPIQFALHVGWLADERTKLTVVGDDDQAIYRFRGSDAACFRQLGPACTRAGWPYRSELLTTNHRSTKNIVRFTQEFRRTSAIENVSMHKQIGSPDAAPEGTPVRVLRGRMGDLAAFVAGEVVAMGYGGQQPPRETVALLSWSTSEKDERPAAALRSALEPSVRLYNPRAKTAARRGSALADLIGVLSYLIDPISMAPVGAGGRNVEVWAQHDRHSASAQTEPPPFQENSDHIDFQKWFRKPTPRSPISPSVPEKQEILDYIDEIKRRLARQGRQNTRLTLSGLIARILTFRYFSANGFTIQLLRQALFTQLLESFVLPTRQTMSPLDSPLEVAVEGGKWVWDDRFWRFIAVFGSVMRNISVDDAESEAFEEGAVPMITFHQAKGLEFDHVYVVGGGRPLEVRSVLKNRLFSGEPISVFVDPNGLTDTADAEIRLQAQADADRELYVAMSRPKSSLTFLSPTDDGNGLPEYAREHPTVSAILSSPGVTTREEGLIQVLEVRNG